MDDSKPIRRVLALHASPRRGGNTDQLLAAFLAKLKDVQRDQDGGTAGDGPTIRHLHPARLAIRPCPACGGCEETGRCIVKDDMTQVYDAVRWAEAIVVASPVFFATVPAQFKAMIDRHQCAWVAKYRLNKPWVAEEEGRRALLLSAGGMRLRSHHDQVRQVVRTWLVVINYNLTADQRFLGVDSVGEINDVPDLAATLAAAAKKISSPPENS